MSLAHHARPEKSEDTVSPMAEGRGVDEEDEVWSRVEGGVDDAMMATRKCTIVRLSSVGVMDHLACACSWQGELDIYLDRLESTAVDRDKLMHDS